MQGAQVSKNALQCPISKTAGTDTTEIKSQFPAVHDTIDSGLLSLCGLLWADKSEVAKEMQATSVKIAMLFMRILFNICYSGHLILVE